MINKDYLMKYISNHYSILPMSVGYDIKFFIVSIDASDDNIFVDPYNTEKEATDAIINYLEQSCFWKHLSGFKNNYIFPVNHKASNGISLYSRQESQLKERPYCEFCGKKIIIDK